MPDIDITFAFLLSDGSCSRNSSSERLSTFSKIDCFLRFFIYTPYELPTRIEKASKEVSLLLYNLPSSKALSFPSTLPTRYTLS